MTREMLRAKMTFEVEIAFNGIPIGGDPDIGADPDIQDIEIEDFSKVNFDPTKRIGQPSAWRNHSLLKGLDAKAKAQLFANIVELIGERELASELLANADD